VVVHHAIFGVMMVGIKSIVILPFHRLSLMIVMKSMIEKQINDEIKTHKGHEKHQKKLESKNNVGMAQATKFNISR